MKHFGLADIEKQKIKSVFQKYRQIKKVMIFGSRAKNTFHERSDIDLVFFAEGKDNQHQLESDVLFDLEELDIPYAFDVKSYQQIQSPPLKEHIDRWGKVFWVNEGGK